MVRFEYYAVLNKFGNFHCSGDSGKPALFKNQTTAQRKASQIGGKLVTVEAGIVGLSKPVAPINSYGGVMGEILKKEFPDAFV